MSAKRMIATAGNYDRCGISAEAIGLIDRDGVVTYRLVGFYEAMNPYRRNTKNVSLICDGGLAIKTNEGAS